MASTYNDVVSSQRGSSALPWCHSRFVLCSSTDWIAALQMPRLPSWDHSRHVCCANRMSCRGRPRGSSGFHPSAAPAPARGYQLGHNGTRGQSKRTGTRWMCGFHRKALRVPSSAVCEGREEHGCKALVQGKGRCKQGRGRFGDGAGKAPGARNQMATWPNQGEAAPRRYKFLPKLGLPSKQNEP